MWDLSPGIIFSEEKIPLCVESADSRCGREGDALWWGSTGSTDVSVRGCCAVAAARVKWPESTLMKMEYRGVHTDPSFIWHLLCA